MIVLVTGPVRSGKSTRAVGVARGFGRPVTHILTARIDPTDAEMADRIARHRAERGGDAALELWTAAAPDLPAAIGAAAPQSTLLVDSLGTWLAGHLLDIEALAERDPVAAAAVLDDAGAALVTALDGAQAHVVLVSEESGWGIVPISAQGRLFRDALGRLARRIAARADRVELVVAGFALDLQRYGVRVEAADEP